MAEELIVEPIVEVAEKVLTGVPRFSTGNVVVIGLGVAICGVSIGYYVGKRRAEAKANHRLEEEIEKFREYLHEKETREDQPLDTSKPPLDEIVEEKGYEDEPEPPKPVSYDRVAASKREAEAVHNVIAKEQTLVFEGREEWDYSLEMKARTANPDDPYVIHADEWNDNELEYEQISYTYFEADDVLVDINDTTVPMINEVVGLGNLQLFGHGSNDPNIVYVRNDDLDIDIEITRDKGSFSETVHGVVEHSEKPKGKGKRRDRRFDDE
jgi:hypothetical protein